MMKAPDQQTYTGGIKIYNDMYQFPLELHIAGPLCHVCSRRRIWLAAFRVRRVGCLRAKRHRLLVHNQLVPVRVRKAAVCPCTWMSI